MIASVPTFKTQHTLEERMSESARVRNKYPQRYPVIVERNQLCVDIDDIDKHKYLVPGDLTMGQLIYVIRKRIKNFSSEKAIFLFMNETMPTTGDNIANLYSKHKDEDGFLYVTYAGENTFG